MPADAFAGNVRGMGPGVAEMEFEERESDPVLVFMAGKTGPGAWNFFLYKVFADPFNTPGLVTDPSLSEGFVFEVHDLVGKRKISFACPEESYSLLAYIGAPSRYVIRHVFKKDGTIAASTSTQRLNTMAGCRGTDDPVMIVRAESGFPSMGEAIEPFTIPVLVAGWMRGAHHGPLMPGRPLRCQLHPVRRSPRVICFGFQVTNGKLDRPGGYVRRPRF